MGNTCSGPTLNKDSADSSKTDGKGSDSNNVQNTPPPHLQIPGDQDEKSKNSQNGDDIVVEDVKRNKSSNLKRVMSAGLQVDTVLGRKTGNLKDIYTLGRKLGQGQFGTTFLCVDKAQPKEFACKSIAKRKLTTEEDVEDVRREIQIMHHLAGHPSVVQIVGAYEDAVAVHVVMELCAGGELFDRIIKRGHYSEKKAAELARVIVGVVEACHSLGVMHRDLKPENFLFVNEKEESSLKTIDFGLSVFFKPGETFTDVVGSPYYVAPEVLRKRYGPECDIWSAGVIIYILLSGVPPFWDETEQGIFEQIVKGELDLVSEPWPAISESAKDLVRKMLVREPKKRLTAHEVLCHPWVRVGGVAPDKPLDSAVLSRLNQFSAMNKLKKIAIRVIAENLSGEEIAGLKQMFKMIDADNSGHITLEELKKGLEKVGSKLKDSEINSLMQAADMDNSGTIDYGEFIAAMLHLNKVQKEDHMYAAFSYFDQDGSGYITQEELQKACEKFGLSNIPMEELMREVDQDNDGRIDYNEFVAMMQDTGFGKNGNKRV
ncbi:calcium-dependent protein kinase 20-like [Solanum pennellii]|uniref:Calcium-dependent protein kinase 20-like n=1 Tax=Solanum pennellii TaxID=28526 RepID=A0ABM1FDZ1_SOLPN|nr:calcium-dependent protein kinase 20-like [Solanum pennellii]XP_015055556.1 calcium-dependent protein kinase 20-like [Solanum pennellii]